LSTIVDNPKSLLLQRVVLELSSVLYNTREALLHKGRKHFEALNAKALAIEHLEVTQMRIEHNLNVLITRKIPIHIKIKGLGYCTTIEKEAIELDLIDLAF